MTQKITYEISSEYKDVRCHKCSALLAKRVDLVQGSLEIKCKCKTINKISFK